MNEMTQALSRLFERHRIIFWYDSKEEFQAALVDVAKAGSVTAVYNNKNVAICQ